MTAASSSGVILPFTSTSIPSLAKTSRPTFCRLSSARTFIGVRSPFGGRKSCLLYARELFHEPGQRVHPLVGGGVVHRDADPAHGAVPLEPDHAALLRVGDELFLQLRAGQAEDHVHHRTALLLHGRTEELRVPVDDAVEARRLLPVRLLDAREAA